MEESHEESSSGATAQQNHQPDDETLSQQQERLEKERAEWLRRINVQKLKDEVRILRGQFEGCQTGDECPRVDVESPASQDNASSSSKHRRDEAEDNLYPSKRSHGEVKVEKPDKYNGKSLRALKEYVRKCEIAFRLAPDRYSQDSTKVLYAIQFLTGEMVDAFVCFENLKGQDRISWDEYKTFLRDQLQDPVTRASTLGRRYNEAVQRPGQTVTQFVNYLDEIEAELEPYDDGHRRQHLLTKLSPELQYALNNYQNQPETRTGLIKLAIQLEANLTGRSRLAGSLSNEPQHPPKERGKGKGRNRNFPVRQKEVAAGTPTSNAASKTTAPRQRTDLSPEEKERRKKESLCFKCGKPNHRAKECRS